MSLRQIRHTTEHLDIQYADVLDDLLARFPRPSIDVNFNHPAEGAVLDGAVGEDHEQLASGPEVPAIVHGRVGRRKVNRYDTPRRAGQTLFHTEAG